MSNKKKQEKDEPKFVVKKRTPKEKPNYFQNIPSFKHPLAEILNFPSSETENLDIQENPPGHSNQSLLDTQSSAKLDTQTNKSLGTQDNLLDTPKQENSGHSTSETLSAETPKKDFNAPRKVADLDTQAPKTKNSGHSKNNNWRRYDQARSTVRVNLHISREIDKKVRQYCLVDANPKVELKEFYEQAALHYLDYLDTQNITSLGAEAPLDNRRLKILFKTQPPIINLYLAYNAVFNELSGAQKGKWAARWTPRDDAAAQRYNDLSLQIIELGIIHTQINKGFGQGKIQTFKYYTEEIEKVLTSGVSDEMLDTVLKYHRQIWKNSTNREIDLRFIEDAKK
jgi:hypothetical protein